MRESARARLPSPVLPGSWSHNITTQKAPVCNDVRAITFEEIKDEVAKDQEMLDLINAIENKDVADQFPDTVAGYNINC